MLLLGIDIGTSSIKVSVVDAHTQRSLITVSYPESEREILALHPDWAEQSPQQWWDDAVLAIKTAHASKKYNPADIKAIGISYQMHGLVMVDKNKELIRNSIIWCDSRAVETGNNAFKTIGKEKCLSTLLNSPGNFTASKLSWVQNNEPDNYNKTYKIMLPGDYIAMKLTGEITSSISSLSEGMFWDFKEKELSKDVFNHFNFDKSLIPGIKNVFDNHGQISEKIARELCLPKNVIVSYKAGDQPNNALSLNVMNPGEFAATAGTSGVIYGVADHLISDPQSRVNSFAHVNHTDETTRIGVLLCINGTGILNSWVKNISGNNFSYNEMNAKAATIKAGSDGLFIIPFGNGAERILNNKTVNAQLHNIDFNRHSPAHIFRASQEGIAFAFRYGLDIMRENNMQPAVIRAGMANMFLSDVFTQAFVDVTNVPVELCNADGSIGAALGAGIGAGIFPDAKEAFSNIQPLKIITPKQHALYNDLYQDWKTVLQKMISN